MMEHLRHRLTAATALAATGMLALSGLALAQEESPAAEVADTPPALGTTDDAQAHPLHIHSGTCEQLGDVIFPLGEISTDLMVHGEAASGETMGGVESQNVAVNVTLVDATFSDLTSTAHAINIHQSEADMGTRIACGDIGGIIVNENALIIRLDELSASGYVGMALLQEGEDGNTTVYSMLTPKEEPADSPPMEEEQTMHESPAPGETEQPAMDESQAPDDQATGDDDVTVTVEVDVEDDASPEVDVTVENAEESPAA